MKTYFSYLAAFGLLAFAQISMGASPQSSPTPEMQKVLDAFIALAPKPLPSLTAVEARLQPTMGDALKMELAQSGQVPSDQGLTNIHDIQIPAPQGFIAARVYSPLTVARSAKAKLPVVLYFHGGGFVIADNDTYDGSARALARQAGALLVSVEYRKAPESRFPAAHDDANTAYKWLLENAGALGGDSRRIAVVGESAGGNLALNVAIFARDNKLQTPKRVVAIYPVAGNDLATESYLENAASVPLNKPMMAWFFQNYLVSIEQSVDPRLNLLAANLKALPPTTLIAAEIDPLRSEGQLLAAAMKQQGDAVDYHLYRGVTHEFFGLADVLPEAQQAQALVAGELKSAF